MDPVTIVVSALAAGAVAGLKPAAEQAVKDAYVGMKALIVRKYRSVDIGPVETRPESKPKRESLAEDLRTAGADGDVELIAQAKALVELLQRFAPDSGGAIGVDLEGVKAASLRVQEVRSTGAGVKVRQGEFTGDIDIGKVDAGRGQDPNV